MASRFHSLLGTIVVLSGLATASVAIASDDHRGGRYEVTITNLTRGQQFTPVLLTSHKSSLSLFQLGRPASPALIILAEDGNTAPLAAALSARPDVGDVVSGNSLTPPGGSTTLVINARGGFKQFSLAAMLIPTNDAFVALAGVDLPSGNDTLTIHALAYDAGSERNDELCASIPGPMFAECGGPGSGGAPGGGEGYVHVHAGMHGIGNFQPANRDWRNPVAVITVRRMR